MLINVAKIRKAFGSSENYSFKEQFENLSLADGAVEFTAPAEVEVKATNAGNSIIVKAHVKTEVKLVCSRCLSVFNTPIETDFEVELCHLSNLGAYLADHPEAVEEEDYTTFSSDEIDFEPLVREHIVLALPMKPLCSEECKGLCSKCGHNLNTGDCGCEDLNLDPRLAGLAKFFNKD